MKHFPLIFLLLLTFINSCNQKVEFNKPTEIDTTVQSNESINNKSFNGSFISLKNIEIKKFPIYDSTNFDNFKEIKKLNKEFIEKLALKKIEPNSEDFQINYQVKYSDSFKTLIITAQLENELRTFLINYDLQYKMIDNIEIAYDEIAESILSTKSVLTLNEIKIEEISEQDELSTTTISKYSLSKSGKIIKK